MGAEIAPREHHRPLRACVCNLMSETISLIDLEKQTPVNIRVGKNPVFSIANPHNPKEIIVTLHNIALKDAEGCIVRVDLKANSVVSRSCYPGAAVPSGMVYDSKRDVLYVADENLNQIYAHDGRNLEVLSCLKAGRVPVHVDISSDERHLAGTNRMSADLHVYDLEQKSAKAKHGAVIRLGEAPLCHPYDVKFSKDPSICYVTDFGMDKLVVVDILKHRVAYRIDVGKMPFGITLRADGTTAYVCNARGNSISVVDLKRQVVVSEIMKIDGYPMHSLVEESLGQLLVTCQGGTSNGSIQIFDIQTEKLVGKVVDDMIQVPIGISSDC